MSLNPKPTVSAGSVVVVSAAIRAMSRLPKAEAPSGSDAAASSAIALYLIYLMTEFLYTDKISQNSPNRKFFHRLKTEIPFFSPPARRIFPQRFGCYPKNV